MLKLVTQSALEKIFPEQTEFKEEYTHASALKGETFAYQIAYRCSSNWFKRCDFSLQSELKDYITLYHVDNVPSLSPSYGDYKDDGLLSTKPGLYPDVLTEFTNQNILLTYGSAWKSIWVDVKLPKDVLPGTYEIKLVFDMPSKEYHEEKVFTLEVIDAELPEQSIAVTQWFHCDGIARMYGDKMFSQRNWKTIKSFIEVAAEHGINTILTPIFTPALDTEIGGERMTAQLVDVTLNNGKYSFDYKKFDKWIDICKNAGVKNFEMAHLFTQWGAKCCPKIIAKTGGRNKRIFGWDTASDSPEYFEFLDNFLPSLVAHLKELGIAQNTVFHISDEPNETHLEMYKKVKSHVEKHLKGFKIMDAISHIEYYNDGVVKSPVPTLGSAHKFIDAKVPDLWVYYCCGTGKYVSNRWMNMPSQRTRVVGFDLFKYNIKGFLHWGYNFYNSVSSVMPVNPYLVTDAMGAFPSGDAFSVYPSFDGKAIPSLRLKVFKHALQDISAMELLAKYIGRDAVIKLIDNQVLGETPFINNLVSAEYVLSTREKINAELKKYI